MCLSPELFLTRLIPRPHPPVFDTFKIHIGAVFMLAGLNSSIIHMYVALLCSNFCFTSLKHRKFGASILIIIL